MTPPFPVTIGIDDIATETQECSGHTLFCLPDVYVEGFTAEAQGIIDRTPGLHGFHGKKYKVGFEGAYREFLQLIKATAGKSAQAAAVNTLLSRNMAAELEAFAARLLNKSLTTAQVPTEPATSILLPYAVPLFLLAKATRDLGPNIEAHVHMDESSAFQQLSTTTHTHAGVQIRAGTILKGVYNGYVEHQHPRAPRLPDDAIAVMRDRKSFLIQAADVLGNFSMAHVFVRLGKASKSKEAKARLIEEVYGDLIDAFDFSKQVRVSNNDLVLADDQASVNFRLGWVMTKGPDRDYSSPGGSDVTH